MKRKLLFIIPLIIIGVISTKLITEKNQNDSKSSEISKLKEKHKRFLDNSPYRDTKKLSKKNRKAKGLPPNAYFEQLWEVTLDPNLGYPDTRGALKIQHELMAANRSGGLNNYITPGAPGQDADNAWIERGPSNVGGRTRGILFDPNDANNLRVFAGGVSGGLWVNNNITDAATVWTLVQGVPENIAVNNIVADPNDPQILYIGSGESYTTGDVIGNGVYRSLDGGVNWEMIFGGPDGTSDPNGNRISINGIFFVNDIITRNVNGLTEVYFAAATESRQGNLSASSLTVASLGPQDRGVYRSTDNGNSWENILITRDGPDQQINPNDLELDINNNIWLATTGDFLFGNTSGGEIFMSTDGINFTFINSTPNFPSRTEIEPSLQNPNVFYIAANAGGANLFVTTDAFQTITPLEMPNDADTTVPEDDYTRGQAFYDLAIEVDPTDDTILYIGGVNSFRGVITVDANDESRSIATNDWQQMSRQNVEFVPSLNISLMHADIHAIVFNPDNPNQALFGTDGGVYYATDLANTPNSTTAIEPRNNGYAVTQFYSGAIDNVNGNIVGGTQDNGGQFNFNPSQNRFLDILTGDNVFSQFDDNPTDPSTGYLVLSRQNLFYGVYQTPITATGNEDNPDPQDPNPSVFRSLTSPFSVVVEGEPGTSNFINAAIVDTNLDILYINRFDVNTQNVQIGRYSNLNSINTGTPNFPETIITDQLITNSFSIVAFQVSPFTTDSTLLFAGSSSGQLFQINNADGGSGDPVVTDITGSEFVGSVSDIEFGANEDTIMVTMSNYGVDSVFYTEDGGTTWTSKEGNLPNIPVFSILQNPLNLNEAIVGTQFGVFRTPNFLDVTPNWIPSFNGMSNVTVIDLDLRPSTNEVLAATYGRGMFTGQFSEFDPDGDDDGDGVLNAVDNCLNTPNLGQEDADSDGLGDVCDNCPDIANADQLDINNDGIGDQCQDSDGDGVLDAQDNCPLNANPNQEDTDGDGIGDVCQDTDGDGILDVEDNCPMIANIFQSDSNGDGIGDACQDSDGDGINDDFDNCIDTPNPDQLDVNFNGQGDVCDTSFEFEDNLDIAVVSESCPGLDNATISITAFETFVNYTVTIAELNLSESLDDQGFISLSEIPGGIHLVCVSVDGRDFETCFEINVAAPELDIDFVGVLPGISQDSQLLTFNVDQGTGPFEVRFNNELIRTTNESTIEVELTGSGLLEIIPTKLCEGIFQFNVDSAIIDVRAFPNPVINELTVSIPGDLNSVPVSIFNITGQLIYQENSNVSGNQITLPFANISEGVYFVRLEMGEAPVVLKIIK